MKKTIFILAAILALFVSCSKQDILTYDSDQPSINFVKAYYLPNGYDLDNDTLKLNAVFYAGKSRTDFKLPVQMSGKIVDYDRSYNVRVVPEKSRGKLVAGVHYSLPDNQILHAGAYADSVIVRVDLEKLRADKISGTLVLEIVPGEEFRFGVDKFRTIGLLISGEGFLSVPLFWTRNKLDGYGGTYSSIKAQKYVELNNIPNDRWLQSSNFAMLFAYGRRTYEWFRDNPTYDNGKLVEFKGTIIYE